VDTDRGAISQTLRLRNVLCLSAFVAAAFVTSRAHAADHEFRLKKPDAQSVMVMGEFNGWKGQSMTKGSDGTWIAKVTLPNGTHAYKFLVNGSDWVFDPDNSKRKTVDGVENSAVEIKGGDSSTPRPLPSTSASPSAAGAGANSSARLDFNILAERKRFDFGRSGTNSSVTTKEKWGYKVTIENKAFAPVSGLEVQYRQFKFDDQLKGSQLVGVAGATNLPALNTGQKFTFETTPVEIERFELRPGWVWTDESKQKVKDRLAGLWLRVLRDGEVVFEWQNPPDLKTNAKWE
jgi:uncharacterized protein affecting Mg2+/Co2+ transport